MVDFKKLIAGNPTSSRGTFPVNTKNLPIASRSPISSRELIVAPTFLRQGSSDRYVKKSASLVPAFESGKQVNCSKETVLLQLLIKCESTSRPICFETIDVILRNKDADKMVRELTGKPVDEAYRQTKIIQLDQYLSALEDLAAHFKIIK